MEQMNKSPLQDLLHKPASNIVVSRIDFSQTALPIYKDSYAVILDNVLGASECETLLQAAEATTNGKGWERALINVGNGNQKLLTDSRNCGRIIWDSQDLVGRIWKRIEHVPEVQEIVRLQNAALITGGGPQRRGEVWKFTRPNERMRFLKYVGGEYFRPHSDGCYETPDRKERSYITMHLYLNNAGPLPEAALAAMTPKERSEAADCSLVGGATTFHSYNMHDKLDVMPKTGRILLFQQRDLLHSGDDVVKGVKYTMRTDLMYTLESTRREAGCRLPVPDTNGSVEDVEKATDGVKEAMMYWGV